MCGSINGKQKLAAYRKYVKRRTAIAESKTSGFFSLVDNEVELLLKATHK